MRCSRLCGARKDIVELLVRQGRLADIQLLNYFTIQLDREVRDGPTATPAAREKEGSAVTTKTEEPPLDSQSRGGKKAAWNSFMEARRAVRRLAATQGPTAWLGEVYGAGERWTSPFSAATRATARRISAEAPDQLRVSGAATAVGSHGPSATSPLPKSIQVSVKLLDSDGDNGRGAGAGATSAVYVTASVPLDQPGVVEKKLVNGVLKVTLNGAAGTLCAETSPRQMAAYQHVMVSTAYSGILERLEKVCGLHATHQNTYDALAIRNPAVQMRLAQLACYRYGVDCLSAYVVGNAAVEEGEEQLDANKGGVLDIPLVESMALNIFAERALMDSLDGAWALVRETPLVTAVAHRSKPEKMIDYPYIQSLLESSKYLLTSSDGTMEEQAIAFMGPILAKDGASHHLPQDGLVQRLLGMAAGQRHTSVRLASPHVNLSMVAAELENDIGKLLQLIATENSREDHTFIISVSQYMSEVMANLAVVYRCTAALNIDEEGRGHREWLLTQAFSSASRARRQRLLDDYTMYRSAATVLRKAKALDNYSTHPVELMNASARKSDASSTASASAKV